MFFFVNTNNIARFLSRDVSLLTETYFVPNVLFGVDVNEGSRQSQFPNLKSQLDREA